MATPGDGLRLDGLHHITMISGDARMTVDFYADVLGLRLVKKTVNFDDPSAYHLYFGDEIGSPGSILTWFDFAGVGRGRAGAGMIHRIQFGVADDDSLDFWAARLRVKGYASTRRDGSLLFEDFEGLSLELVLADPRNRSLRAAHPEVPAEYAILGVEGARAYTNRAWEEAGLLTQTLGFTHLGRGEYALAGDDRQFRWAHDPPPVLRGRQGAGTVHHIAWATPDADQLAWQQRISETGLYVTDVRDRDYFRSIYFREPRGILLEIATHAPGFAVDEDPDHLGEELRVPEMYAHLRRQLLATLTPLVNPRIAQREQTAGS
ncbi:MAG: glyoxalase family protein [Solirubrobacteraceae bacterium]|nr:glyoxalase family protein [Solirubrobacteraceae bacterium]